MDRSADAKAVVKIQVEIQDPGFDLRERDLAKEERVAAGFGFGFGFGVVAREPRERRAKTPEVRRRLRVLLLLLRRRRLVRCECTRVIIGILITSPILTFRCARLHHYRAIVFDERVRRIRCMCEE